MQTGRDKEDVLAYFSWKESFIGCKKLVNEMEVKIFGMGCAKCNALEENVKKALSKLRKNVEIEKVSDMAKIIEYGVVITPALMINGKVVSSGKVLSPEEIEKFIK